MEKITVYFILPNGETIEIKANVGESVLDVAHQNNLPLEGACEGSLACSTCHVVIDENWFEGELAKKSEEEEDLLDMVVELHVSSRLGCQVRFTSKMDGLIIRLVQDTINFIPSEYRS